MTFIHIIGGVLFCLVVGAIIGVVARKKIVESRVDSIENYSRKILAEAQQEAKTIKKEAELQAKDSLYQMKLEFEKGIKETREQLLIQEKRLLHREENLDKKTEQLEKREERKPYER